MSRSRKAKYKGRANNSAKLTIEEVKEIKKLLAEGVPRKIICEKLKSASYETVNKIARGDRWAHVKINN